MIRRLQALLQWLFMRVEALFNGIFGDRLNPLYHLGAISFFLFWVVCGSGLYLYAFFETGVADAYTSVEALTQRQWFAGGVLRSVHRYASDAIVITMLLHLTRHFAFDRFRGFRWFSWVSGVALLWGVYVSGINGYMLPWDKMAQFVIVASFEWLDWLPGFGGTLSRNFIHPANVNDRFFSLLAFMHIGIPLVVLLLMFIHVQRVPKASTNPPRPIMMSLLFTLLVLSVLHPALSQGGAANLSVAVTELQFDWFLLALFPLFYALPLAQVWALVGAGTALLVALPWLPPGLRRSRTGEFQLTIHPSASAREPVRLRSGETLLEAGLRHGLALPFECRNGGCGVCRCTVLHGQVDHGAYQRGALSDAQRAQGQALMCCATALTDLEVEVEGSSHRRPPMAEHVARVDRIERLSADLVRLTLALPGGETMAFQAGQYINIVLDDGQRRAFSFANPPQVTGHIELHVRRIPGGLFTGHVFTQMKVGDTLRFEGPLGDFSLRESAHPILFVAGATGFAPVKSIVEDAFARGVARPMWLYWGGRKRADLYALELAEQWQRDHRHFHFVAVLSEPDAADAWTGRTGLVHEAMLQDFPDLREHEVYVCGSVKMVEAAVPAFLTQGLGEAMCFSDAFVPSGR
ncbi:MAG: FAD-binding oxidoreductase [Burkholderiaceae bacterium]